MTFGISLVLYMAGVDFIQCFRWWITTFVRTGYILRDQSPFLRYVRASICASFVLGLEHLYGWSLSSCSLMQRIHSSVVNFW